MPQFRFPRLTPTVKKLLILLAAAFVILAVVQNLAGIPLFQWLALDVRFAGNADALYLNLLWQPLTYWLVYPPVPNALLDFGLILLGIYFFLSPFEEAFGPKRTIQLSAVGVLGAALPCVLLGFLLPASRQIAGAGPIALASLGAFPVIARGREILFMFVIPMKAWTVILLGLGISALLAVLARDPFIFVEYSGALGAGLGYAKWMVRPRGPRRPTRKPPRRGRGPDLRVLRGGADDDDKPRWLN